MELQDYMNLIYMAGHNPRHYNMREFVLGMDRESEHELSKDETAKIVLRHLKEDSTYYTKLNAVIPVIEDGMDESESIEEEDDDEEEEEIPDENEQSLLDPAKIKVKKKLPMQKEEWV